MGSICDKSITSQMAVYVCGQPRWKSQRRDPRPSVLSKTGALSSTPCTCPDTKASLPDHEHSWRWCATVHLGQQKEGDKAISSLRKHRLYTRSWIWYRDWFEQWWRMVSLQLSYTRHVDLSMTYYLTDDDRNGDFDGDRRVRILA